MISYVHVFCKKRGDRATHLGKRLHNALRHAIIGWGDKTPDGCLCKRAKEQRLNRAFWRGKSDGEVLNSERSEQITLGHTVPRKRRNEQDMSVPLHA